MKMVALKISIVTALLAFAFSANAFAGISGSMEAEYTSHSVNDPVDTKSETAASLSQKYSMFYTKRGVLGNSIAYNGFLGGELYGIKNWFPSEESISTNVTASQSSIGGLLGKGWQSRMITGGVAEFVSPWRWLPAYLKASTTDDSLPIIEKNNLYRTFGSSPILPVDFSTGVILPERTYQNIFLGVGFRNSISADSGRNLQGVLKPNLVTAEIEERESESNKKLPLWNSLPYLQVTYNKNGMKVKRDYYGVDDEQSNLTASLGKDKFWLNYLRTTYDNKMNTFASWTNQRYELGTISESGYRYTIDVDDYRFKFSPNIYYATRDGKEGFKEYGASLMTEGKIYYPTLEGWTEGDVKTYWDFDNRTGNDGSSSSEYRLPTYFLHSNSYLSERIRIEKSSNKKTTHNGSSTSDTNIFTWNADINKTGEYLFQPAITINNTTSDTASALSVETSLNIYTTPKYSKTLNLNIGYDLLYNNWPADIYKHRISGGVNYRLSSHSSIYFNQSFSFIDFGKLSMNSAKSLGTLNTYESATGFGYSYFPNSKYTLSLTGNLSIANTVTISQSVLERSEEKKRLHETYHLNLSSVYRTGNLTIDMSNWISNELGNPIYKYDNFNYESRNVAAYNPIRSTEVAGECELHYNQSDSVSRRMTARQRATYRYYGRLQKEYWSLQQNATMTTETTTSGYGTGTRSTSQSDSKSIGVNLNLTPGTKFSANARVNYADSTTGRTVTYGGGVNVNFNKLQMSADWQAGSNSAGREETKWTVSIRKTF